MVKKKGEKVISPLYLYNYRVIKVWDLRKNYTVHKKDPLAKHMMNYTGSSARNGFSSLLVCPARITLYASCMDNIIYAYNISSYNPKPGNLKYASNV